MKDLNKPNITLTLINYPNITLSFLLPLKVKARFNNDLATIFNRCLYIFVILYLLLKGIKARQKLTVRGRLDKIVIF